MYSFSVAPILPVLIPLAIDPRFMVSSQDVQTVNVNSTTETEIQLYVPRNLKEQLSMCMYILYNFLAWYIYIIQDVDHFMLLYVLFDLQLFHWRTSSVLWCLSVSHTGCVSFQLCHLCHGPQSTH